MLPQAVTDHDAEQAGILDVVLRGIGRAWGQMAGRNWEQAWRNDVGPVMVDVVSEGQQTAAAGADAYMAAVLAELGIKSAAPTRLNLATFAGVAGDGRLVESLLYGGVIKAAKAQYRPDMAALPPIAREAAALGEAMGWIQKAVTTVLADTTRAAETVAMTQHDRVEGYIRMLDPKNPCSRCVVLAGKFYRRNQGFERHEACRCIHIPYAENLPHDILTNPSDYFDSLSATEQDRVFTAAGAEAIRLGADVSQVVNARRGMHTAQQNPRGWIPKGRLKAVQMHGRDVFVTTEGVTKGGVYGKKRGSKLVRLMPESILSIAEDREDSIRLLKLYGFISDAP